MKISGFNLLHAGSALGVALCCWYQMLDNKRVTGCDAMKGAYLGPHYKDSEIKNYLDTENIPYRKLGEIELSDCR